MLDQAVAYAKQREQFNRPIGSFQAVKHMCAEMAAQLEPCAQWFGLPPMPPTNYPTSSSDRLPYQGTPVGGGQICGQNGNRGPWWHGVHGPAGAALLV